MGKKKYTSIISKKFKKSSIESPNSFTSPTSLSTNVTRKNLNKKKKIALSYKKVQKRKESDLEILVDDTEIKKEVTNEKELSEIISKSESNIAYYQYLYSKNLKKENKGKHSIESIKLMLKASLFGCTNAEVDIIDNINEYVVTLLGNNPLLFNFSNLDAFILYGLGTHLLNYRNLKRLKTYEEWQKVTNSEEIKISFTSHDSKNESILNGNFIKSKSNSNVNCNKPLSTMNSVIYNPDSINRNLLNNFYNANNKKKYIKEIAYQPDDINSYEKLGLILLDKASESNYILAQIEKLRKKHELNPDNQITRSEYHELIKRSAIHNISRAKYLCFEEFVLKNENPSEKDINTNLNYLESAAWEGYYLAQYQFAKIKELGLYDQVICYNDSFFWCSKASEHGYDEAEFTLSTYFSSGIGVRKSLRKAFDLMIKADESFHKDASLYIALKYREGCGVEENAKLAFRYAKKSFFNYRNLEGAFLLGTMYFNGAGTSYNFNAAFKCFQFGSKLDHVRSNYMLGELYYNGNGCTKNVKKAFIYYKKAALANDAKALCKLSLCFLLGEGIYRDNHRALACLNTAASIDYNIVDEFITKDDGQNVALFESLTKFRFILDEDNAIEY